MMFIAGWLGEYGKALHFPIETEYLSGEQAGAGPGSRLTLALSEGAVAVVRVLHTGDEHYILLTGISGSSLYAWDPYYLPDREILPECAGASDVEWITDRPFFANRRFPVERLNGTQGELYNMGAVGRREAIIIFNSETRIRQPFEPDYAI
jgi:hypothetical protein